MQHNNKPTQQDWIRKRDDLLDYPSISFPNSVGPPCRSSKSQSSSQQQPTSHDPRARSHVQNRPVRKSVRLNSGGRPSSALVVVGGSVVVVVVVVEVLPVVEVEDAVCVAVVPFPAGVVVSVLSDGAVMVVAPSSCPPEIPAIATITRRQMRQSAMISCFVRRNCPLATIRSFISTRRRTCQSS